MTISLDLPPQPQPVEAIPEGGTLTVGDLCLVNYGGEDIDDALPVRSVDRHGNPTFLHPRGYYFTVTPEQCRVTLPTKPLHTYNL